MSTEALIFDVDGTLADTEELHRSAFNQAFDKLGLGWQWSPAEYRSLLQVTGGKERITAYLRQRSPGVAPPRGLLARVPEIHAEKTRLYTAMVQAGELALRPGVVRLLEEAQQAGLRLAIASTTTAANIDALLQSTLGTCGLDLFDVVACGDQVRHKKPAPDIYALALETLGVAPERAIAFEDSINGLHAATAAGLWTVVTPTYWSEGDDFATAGLVLPHLGDADHPLLRGEAGKAALPSGTTPSAPPWLTIDELLRMAARQPGLDDVNALHRMPARSVAAAVPRGATRSEAAEPDLRTRLEFPVPRTAMQEKR